MEYQDELGLDNYDFGARNYHPELGRWFNIDPFAELMRNQSPYNYGFNNPIYFSDMEGNIPWPMPEFFKIWRRKNTPDEYFGYIKRRGRSHNGLDLNYNGGGNTDLGAPIVATHSGRVARIIPLSANDGGGRVIVIESPDGSFQAKYMHLSSVTVQAGQEISEGQTIGLMGGSAFGKELGRTAHLHYEIHQRNSNGTYSAINPWSNSAPIDPQKWVKPTSLVTFNGLTPDISNFVSRLNDYMSSSISAMDGALKSAELAITPRAAVSSVGTITPGGLSPLPAISPSGGTVTPVTPVTPPVVIPPVIIPKPPFKD